MTTAPSPITAESIQQEVSLVVAEGQAIAISDQESYDRATKFLVERLNPKLDAINAFFDPNIKSAHELHKSLLAHKSLVLGQPTALKLNINRAIIKWDDEKELERQEAQRKAVEAQRVLDEELRLQSAAEVESQGGTEEEVQRVLETPVMTTSPVVAPVYNRAQGVSTKTLWRAEIKAEADGTTFDKSMRELCAAIGRGEQPVSYVEPNLTALGQIARAQREAMNVPGVKAVSNKSIASRSRG